MFWVCLRFPQLVLDALRTETESRFSAEHLATPPSHPTRGSAVLPSRPFAVIDGALQRRHVVLANAAALRSGVRTGQPLATAQMFCPRLLFQPRDQAAEQQMLESLAAWAYRFSAEIHIATPDSVFIEAGASLALFGGWPALQRRLRSELDAFGFAFSFAAAPTATAAQVLAVHADGIAVPALAQLAHTLEVVPLSASGLDPKTILALHGMGFRILRDLFRLPRAELARRIGQGALDHLDRMRGSVSETLIRWHPPQRFERRIEFSFGVESQTALAFPLQRLIGEFAFFLIARDSGVQHFSLVLGHERNARTRIEVGLLTPQRDATALFELARVRLERVEPGAAVHALTLCADDLPSLCPLHEDLFEANLRQQLDWPALTERLRARLGDEALRSVRCVADHRPGRAWRFASASTDVSSRPRASGFSRGTHVRNIGAGSIAVEAAATQANAKAVIPPLAPKAGLAVANAASNRPFWLLQRPIPLRGAPPRVLAGPERIESGWWDEHDQRRDYYMIEIPGGQRAWAFVEAGSSADIGSRPHWTLHGWFA